MQRTGRRRKTVYDNNLAVCTYMVYGILYRKVLSVSHPTDVLSRETFDNFPTTFTSVRHRIIPFAIIFSTTFSIPTIYIILCNIV